MARKIKVRPTLAACVATGLAFLLVVGAITSQNNLLFLTLGATIAVVPVGLIGPKRAIRSVQIETLAPPTPAARSPFTAAFRISNLSARAVFALQIRGVFELPEHHDGFDEHKPVKLRAGVATLQPGASRSLVSDPVDGLSRGVYQLEDAAVSTSFPLGLWRASAPIGSGVALHVAPEPIPSPVLSTLPLATGARPQDVAVSSATPGADVFHSLRPFQRGDRRRDIAWRASARRDDVVSMHRIDETTDTHLVVAFAWSASDRPADFEKALSIVAACVRDAELQQRPISVVGPSPYSAPSLDANHILEIRRALAALSRQTPVLSDDFFRAHVVVSSGAPSPETGSAIVLTPDDFADAGGGS